MLTGTHWVWEMMMMLSSGTDKPHMCTKNAGSLDWTPLSEIHETLWEQGRPLPISTHLALNHLPEHITRNRKVKSAYQSILLEREKYDLLTHGNV